MDADEFFDSLSFPLMIMYDDDDDTCTSSRHSLGNGSDGVG